MDASGISKDAAARIFRLMCSLAWSDGRPVLKEREDLELVRGKLGIDPADAERLAQAGAPDTGGGWSLEEERFLLAALGRIAASDGQLHREESDRLDEIAAECGLDPKAVQKAVLDRLMGPPTG